MVNKSFALLAVAIILVAGAGGAIVIKSNDGNSKNEEVDQFLEICKVPRVSGHNEKIGDYLVQFATDHDLPYQRDSVGNVLIDHPGLRNNGLILQCHMDMVGITEQGFTHDFTKDPIITVIKDGVITAEHTTLGADNGAGMAIALCALKSPELTGYGFRCIFTVDEESDSGGATHMSKDWLEGYRFLLNIDHEYEGDILIGSAGCYCFHIADEFETAQPPTGSNTYKFRLYGLLGGHSGACIDMNRANAILLSMELMDAFENVQLISVNGGDYPTAIPCWCDISFSCDESESVVRQTCQAKAEEWRSKYADKDLMYDLMTVTGYSGALTITDSKKLIDGILSSPNGVLLKEEGSVLVSSNIGVINLINGKFSMTITSRSNLTDGLSQLEQKFVDIFGRENVILLGSSPSWVGNGDSLICKVAMDSYERITGKGASISTIHASLEIAYFDALCPGIEMISIGPEISDAHTIHESITVETLHNTKLTVFEIIKMIA